VLLRRMIGLVSASVALGVVGLGLASPASAITGPQIVSVINAERHANGLPLYAKIQRCRLAARSTTTTGA
jgi:hypothetical protein